MAKKYAINLSIPRGLDIYRGQTSKRSEQFTNLPLVGVLVCCVNLNIKGLLTLLP
jgi:hypothetical protein